VNSQLLATVALPARIEPSLPTEYKAGLAQSLFGLFEEELNMLLLSRTEQLFRLSSQQASRCSDYAIPINEPDVQGINRKWTGMKSCHQLPDNHYF